MKTYEEMARDVQKRRDEELNKTEYISTETITNPAPETIYPASKKRRLFPKIAIPCTAAVTAAAVGITVWHNMPLSKNKEHGEYVNNLVTSPSTSYELAVIIGEGNAPSDRDYSDVYKGGKTEIIYNELKVEDTYDYAPPQILAEDFVNIPDDKINEFYGIKFDRLNEVFGEGEHSPFGYYNRDIESDGMVMHAVHGYYNVNTIQYDGLGGFALNVKASYDKRHITDVERKAKSVINGFDSVVYELENDTMLTKIAEIDMNGVLVTIQAYFPCDMIKDESDPRSNFENVLLSYTAPIDSSDVSAEKLVINKECPEYLNKHGFYRGGCISAPVRRVYFNHEEINEFYGIEFDRMGRLHSDWIGKSSRYMEKICPEEFLCFVLTDNEHAENGADGWDDENAEPNISFASDENLDELEFITSNNTLTYTIKDTDTSILSIEAARTGSPEDMFSPFTAEGADPETFSKINGYNALIWSESGETSTSYTAIIEMGKTLVCMSSSAVSEDVFLGFVREFTMPMSGSDSEPITEFHILDEMPQIVCENDPFKPTDNDGKEFTTMTIEETNSYYNIEFDCLGDLHSDWNERGMDKLGIYYKDYPSDETSDGAVAGGRDIPTGQINTLEYDIPKGKYISVSAVIGTIPGIVVEDGEYYQNSYVNGLNAVIYCGEDFDLGAMVQIGGTVVDFTSTGLSDEEFEDILCEFTENNDVRPEYVFID